MTTPGEEQQPAARIVRAREGRLVGGVCAGLPDILGLGTNGLRLVFIVGALLGGIGIVVYLACWLVIPAADQDPDRDPVRSVVLLAWATGGLVALVLIAAAAALATVFGLGWVVFGIAAIVAAAMFSPLRTRIPQAVALLTLAALTLPAVAVALSPLRLTLQSGQSYTAPRTFDALGQTVYRSGFGTLLIDLRRTRLPTSGTATTLRVDAGVRRTIVALPSDKCVRVRVNYDIHLFPAHLAALLTGRFDTPFHDVVLFGRPYGYGTRGGPSGTAVQPAAGSSGPLLTIDFTSQGGGLYVRDYPTNVDPALVPQWPGYPVTPEPKPYLKGEPRKVQKQMLRDWHQRLTVERANQQQVDVEMRGPCAA
jgi:phage shock protein PspC (stress-responsive transcriptional regulator)